MITRDQLLSLTGSRECTVAVPALGGEVVVKRFTQAELRALLAEATVGGELQTPRAERLLLQRGLVDPALDEAATDAIVQGAAAVYYGLLHAILEANGLTDFAVKEAKRSFRP